MASADRVNPARLRGFRAPLLIVLGAITALSGPLVWLAGPMAVGLVLMAAGFLLFASALSRMRYTDYLALAALLVRGSRAPASREALRRPRLIRQLPAALVTMLSPSEARRQSS